MPYFKVGFERGICGEINENTIEADSEEAAYEEAKEMMFQVCEYYAFEISENEFNKCEQDNKND